MVIRREIEEMRARTSAASTATSAYGRPTSLAMNSTKLQATPRNLATNLFRVQGQDEEVCLKPMICPHHMQIFADNHRSYRDLPARYFEPGTVYREERTGQLSGLTRVRAITQDDGHIFCRIDQI
jgi:Threonyl-tRNA synthetase